MTGPNYASRRSRLVRSLKVPGIDGLLVSGVANVRYLTGFSGDSTWLFVSSATTVLISDTRYQTQLATECPGVEAVIRDATTSMMEFVSQLLQKTKVKRLGIEADHLTVAQHAVLAEKLPNVELVSTSDLTERLRSVKDRWELQQIRDAIAMAERGISVVCSSLRPDQTEREIRYLLEAAMRDFGANGPAFEPIVGVGPTGALPHAHAGDLRVGESPMLLIDWGAETRTGYRSDLTRAFITGKPTKQMRTVYETVLAAQQAAIAAIKPGVLCRDVDAVARGMIADAGYGRHFGHGLGHGFGLEIHESVRLSPLSEETLRPGTVVTVEPGIYLRDRFGVRIEDDVLVTKDGCEVLTSVPREFEQAVMDFLA
ncbi:MAG: Xaa-Pro peptidase family protein [Planctomycetaceae bacterium]